MGEMAGRRSPAIEEGMVLTMGNVVFHNSNVGWVTNATFIYLIFPWHCDLKCTWTRMLNMLSRVEVLVLLQLVEVVVVERAVQHLTSVLWVLQTIDPMDM